MFFKLKNLAFILGMFLLAFSVTLMYFSMTFFNMYKTLFIEWEVMISSNFNFSVLFLLDWISLSFMSTVLMISSVVMYYSFFYMSEDKNTYKFIILVFLFVISMILMIMSPNLISILLGWDGLGLISYCLVIYYNNMKSFNAGMLTILTNRIGDVALLLSISWAMNFGTWSIISLKEMFNNQSSMIIMVMILIAGLTKSAQIPFSAWLPAAMAAPTPVSSLVHSSTLVTAGVYLMIRFSPSLEINFILFLISLLTMFMSGLSANFEMDLKKIIALSTLSQLGMMMMILSMGLVELAYLHLLTHALFKSLLFLCAGMFIHSSADCQDIRFLGNMWMKSPINSFFFFGSSLSLCGFPFMSGFYSKDLILEFMLMNNSSIFSLILMILSILFTVLYTIRLLMISFMNNLNSKKNLNMEDELGMAYPMSILFLFSILGGSMINWLFFPKSFIFLSFEFKSLVILVLLFSVFLSFLLKSKTENSSTNQFVSMMWNIPVISTYYFTTLIKNGLNVIKYFDQGWLEMFSGQGGMKMLIKKSMHMDKYNNISLKYYLSLFFIFIIIFTKMFFLKILSN